MENIDLFKASIKLARKLYENLSLIEESNKIDVEHEGEFSKWKYKLDDILHFLENKSKWIDKDIDENEFVCLKNIKIAAIEFKSDDDYDTKCRRCVFALRNERGQFSCQKKLGIVHIPHCSAKYRKDNKDVYFKVK